MVSYAGSMQLVKSCMSPFSHHNIAKPLFAGHQW